MSSSIPDGDAQQVMQGMGHDHDRLHGLTHRLRAAIEAGDTARSSQIFDELRICERHHFVAEERAMQRFDFPGFGDHKGQHDGLSEMLAAIGAVLVLERPRTLHRDIAAYAEWTLDHIRSADRAFADFLRDQHPAPASQPETPIDPSTRS